MWEESQSIWLDERDIRRYLGGVRELGKCKGKQEALNLKGEIFKRSELLRKYTAKILFEWNDRRFRNKYLKKLERSLVR